MMVPSSASSLNGLRMWGFLKIVNLPKNLILISYCNQESILGVPYPEKAPCERSAIPRGSSSCYPASWMGIVHAAADQSIHYLNYHL